RNAVLSVKVFEFFETANAERRPGSFDRTGLWGHMLAVATAAEPLAASLKDRAPRPDEAFVCGLLQDLGKLALDHVMPRSYARCVELAEMNQADIAQVERRVLGLDHHTAGKRLAEQWGLAPVIVNTIWLHGHAPSALPHL